MLPTMYGNYATRGGVRSGVGQTEPAGPVVEVDGVQQLTSEENAKIAGYLGALYLTPAPAPAEGVQSYMAMPCDEAKRLVGEAACTVTAFAGLETRPPGSSVLVSFPDASSTSVGVLLVVGSENVTQQVILRQLAATNSNYALFQAGPRGTKKEEEKKEKVPASTLLVGAGAGGAAGFFTAGPVGAVVGAAAGGLLANWLAA